MKQLSLWVMLAFWAVFGTFIPGRCEIVDRVVAVVNGEAITLSIVEDEMNAIWVEPQKVPRSRQDALQNLIDHKLMLQEAIRTGVTVSEESLSTELAKVISSFPTPDGLFQALLDRGITQEDLEENLIEAIMVKEMIDLKFRRFLEVSDGEASVYFEQNKAEFVMPEAVHLNQLFFPLTADADETEKAALREKVADVFRQLRNGASFSDYANNTGKADYIPVNQLIPIVADAVSRMKAGEIGNLIETPAGYFIIKLNDRRSARQASFDEAREDIKKILLQQKTDAELADWLKRRREAANIIVKVKFNDQ